MPTDYEEFYQDNPNGLGQPTQAFVDFFKSYDQPNAKVLDVGCGQGRDAVFIARLGHSVTGVDFSPTGIRDLTSIAKEEALNIEAIVADIREYECVEYFDVIVIDRTLHMLAPEERINVLEALLRATKPGSHLLIADEKLNLPAFKSVLAGSKWDWRMTLEKNGFLFAQRGSR